MATPPPSNLSHDELAALDLVILSALQQGKGLDEPMSFIDSIVHAVNDAVNYVAGHAQEVVDVAAHVVEVTAEVAEAAGEAAALQDNALSAIKRVVSTTAQVPDVTLAQLIEIRRRAISGSSGAKGY